MRCPECRTTSWGIYTIFEIQAGRDVVGMVPKSLFLTAVRLAAEGKVVRKMDRWMMGRYVVTKKGRAAMRCACARARLAQYDAPLRPLRDIRRG